MKAMSTQISASRQLKPALLVLLLFLLVHSFSFAGDIDNRAAGAYEMLGSLTSEEITAASDLSVAGNTLFSFSIPRKEYVRFSVFDVYGKEIAVLINDFKRAGDFSADLNKAKLTKGTYYYRLIVGRYREIRKLEIIK